MSRVFSKGFIHEVDTGLADQLVVDELKNTINSKSKPTGLATPNRKLVSPEAGVRQSNYALTPPPPEFTSEALADDMIKVYEVALKTEDNLPEDELSIFLKTDAYIGSVNISTKNLMLEKDVKAGLTVKDYLSIQNGEVPAKDYTIEKVEEIKTYGHLAGFVHNDKDVHYQVAYHKLRNLGAKYHVDSTKYDNERHWGDFVWFNAPYHCHLMSAVLHHSLSFAWQSKFNYNLPRPEVYGYVLDQHPDELPYADKVKNSKAGQEYFAKYGTYLLKQFYLEGSPTHPSYPQGHQSVAFGVGFVLRYIYELDQEFEIGDKTYNVGEEIKKLSYNIAYARTYAGVHYYCDTDDCIEAAEENAAKIIKEINKNYPFAVNTHNVTGATGKKYIV